MAETQTQSTGGNQEISSEQTIFAEPIFHLGGFTVTNSLFTSWLVVIVIFVLVYMIKRSIKEIPRGIQNFFEFIMEAFFNLFDSITGSREKSTKFFPLAFTFFLFILLSNWLGLLPGFGSFGQVVVENGEKVFIPYLRAATADLNTTLALATIGVVASHIVAAVSIGFWKYFNKFINIQVLLEIPKKVRKDSSVLFVSPVKFLVGLLEILAEFAKIASLSFQLFGNIYAGEVLLASMSAILAFGLPLPFMFLEVMVGLIQALIFSVLILSYLNMLAAEEGH